MTKTEKLAIIFKKLCQEGLLGPCIQREDYYGP